jgi:hypothetical protein
MASETSTIPAAATPKARVRRTERSAPNRTRSRPERSATSGERSQRDHRVQRERSADAFDRRDGGPRDRPDRVGREDAGHSLVRAARPELEDREGDADPEPRCAEALQEPRREPGRKPVAEDEAGVTDEEQRERGREHRPRPRALGNEPVERVADSCAKAKQATSAPATPGPVSVRSPISGRTGASIP